MFFECILELFLPTLFKLALGISEGKHGSLLTCNYHVLCITCLGFLVFLTFPMDGLQELLVPKALKWWKKAWRMAILHIQGILEERNEMAFSNVSHFVQILSGLRKLGRGPYLLYPLVGNLHEMAFCFHTPSSCGVDFICKMQ